MAADDFVVAGAVSRSGVAMDPDGLHVWICVGTTSVVKKLISTGVTVTTITGNASDGGTRVIATPSGLTRFGAKLYFACAGAGTYLGEIDTSTLVCRLYAQSTVAAPYHAMSGESGKAWMRTTSSGAGTYQEFSLAGTGDSATATPTARTQASMWDAVSDGAGYIYFTNGSAVVRLKLSDSTTVTLSSINVAIPNLPGYGALFRGLLWDPVGAQVLIFNGAIHDWCRADSALAGFTGRAFGFQEYAGPLLLALNTAYQRAPAGWSNDGLKLAMLAYDSGAVAATASFVRVVNMGVQRARWTWTPGRPAIIRALRLPGDYGNARGSFNDMPNSPTYLASTHEHRKARWYYAVGAGARVEYRGEALAVAVAASGADGTVTLDCDMQLSVNVPLSPRPSIGGEDGGGPVIIADHPSPRRQLQGAL